MTDNEKKLVRVAVAAYKELNTIRARDGVPYTHYGKSDVCPDYFSSVVDELDRVVGEVSGKSAHCHPMLYEHAFPENFTFLPVLKWSETGSKVICNPPPQGTDTDYIVLAKNWAICKNLCDMGFDVGGSWMESPDFFQSYKKDDVNIIVTISESFYNDFVLATKVCKELNLLEKRQRIMVFQAILYKSFKPDWGVTPTLLDTVKDAL